MSHSKRVPPLALLAAWLCLSAASCGDSSPAPTPPAPSAAPSAAVETTHAPGGDQPERFTLEEAIAQRREDLKSAPGRTGILAETKRYSLFDEELIIRDFFQDRRGGFFVDVGCAWPAKANNTYYLEKHLDWKGIGIDALAEYALPWSLARPNSKFFNYLVTDHSDTSEIFYKSQSIGLSSADRSRADGRHFGGTLEVEEIETQTIALTDLLDHEGVEKVDLLALDIEGFEMPALRGFDIDRFSPDLVVVEGRSEEVAAYFADHGYEPIESYRAFDLVNSYYRPIEVKAVTP
jgi:FkbM family methyltransferase